MHNNDLENKKINEGFSGENLPDNYDPAPTKLKQELETDENGNEKSVERARTETESDANPNSGVAPDDDQKMKLAQNKDRNSDIAANRYPNGHPDNERDRGNIKLDDE